MTVSVTLQYTSVAAMLADLGRLAPIAAAIAHNDRPDVGAPTAPPPAAPVLALVPPAAPPAVDTAAIFGGAATPTLPTVPAVPEVAAVPAVPTLPTAVKLDKTGLPWDARIHATNSEKTGGTLNGDGTWRSKRGLNDGALVARVEAELRQAMAAPAASTPTAAAAPTVAPVATPPAPPAVVSPPPTPAQVAAPAVPAGTPSADTFAGLMAHLAPTLTANPTNGQAWLSQALLGAGITGGVGVLATRPDLIPSVRSTFDALAAA